MDIIFLAFLCGLCAVAWRLKPGLLGQLSVRPGYFLRKREFMGLVQSVTCGCCGIAKKVGMEDLDVPSKILQVTLVGLYKAKDMGEVYLQVSTDDIDPKGGHAEFSKNSRIHRVSGGAADLKAERLEFDWFGDEPGLTIIVRAYTPIKSQQFHGIVGQVFVSREHVIKYAAMAAQQPDSFVNGGAQCFSIKPANWVNQDSDTVKFDQMKSSIFGEPPKSVEEELRDLRAENEALRRQLQGLPPEPEKAPEQPKEIGQLVVRVDLQESKFVRVAHDDATMYRQASFDLEDGQGALFPPGALQSAPSGPSLAGGMGSVPLKQAAAFAQSNSGAVGSGLWH
jgi:hypothetical protein